MYVLLMAWCSRHLRQMRIVQRTEREGSLQRRVLLLRILELWVEMSSPAHRSENLRRHRHVRFPARPTAASSCAFSPSPPSRRGYPGVSTALTVTSVQGGRALGGGAAARVVVAAGSLGQWASVASCRRSASAGAASRGYPPVAVAGGAASPVDAASPAPLRRSLRGVPTMSSSPLPAPTARVHRSHHSGSISSLVLAIPASPGGPSVGAVAVLAAEPCPCESPRQPTSDVPYLPPSPSRSQSSGQGGGSPGALAVTAAGHLPPAGESAAPPHPHPLPCRSPPLLLCGRCSSAAPRCRPGFGSGTALSPEGGGPWGGAAGPSAAAGSALRQKSNNILQFFKLRGCGGA